MLGISGKKSQISQRIKINCHFDRKVYKNKNVSKNLSILTVFKVKLIINSLVVWFVICQFFLLLFLKMLKNNITEASCLFKGTR